MSVGDDSLKKKEFPTLRHIIDYVVERTSALEEEKVPEAEERTEAPIEDTKEEVPEIDEKVHWESVKESVLKIVSDKTGYPVEMLEIDLDLASFSLAARTKESHGSEGPA